MKALMIFLIIYCISAVLVKILSKSEKKELEDLEWLFDLDYYFFLIGVIPIVNTIMAMSMLFERIKSMLLYWNLTYKLNRIARRHGFKSFNDLYNATKNKADEKKE